MSESSHERLGQSSILLPKLKTEYPNNPRAVYGTLNAIGAMRGNKETPKGKAMARKHAAKGKKR